MRLLIADADDKTAGYLARGLGESGHVVDRVAEGETALVMALEGIYDALLIDSSLPDPDGLTVVRSLRRRNDHLPVMMLSTAGSTADRIIGIQAGCDAYLVKPYAFAELLARLEALVRRADRHRRASLLTLADLEFDTAGHVARRGGVILPLQPRELRLLEILLRHAGQVVTRSMLLEGAWDYEFEPRGNIIDMHIHRLRQKIDRSTDRPLIHTVPGAGYRMAEE